MEWSVRNFVRTSVRGRELSAWDVCVISLRPSPSCDIRTSTDQTSYFQQRCFASQRSDRTRNRTSRLATRPVQCFMSTNWQGGRDGGNYQPKVSAY